MDENTKKVIETFEKSDKPLKSGEVSEITGFDAKEITKIINNLKKDGTIESPKKCYYQIKK